MLGIDLHGWELVMLLALGIVAIGGVAVVAATYGVIMAQRSEVAAANRELETYKANAAAEIAAANATGEIAKRDAADANARAAAAHERSASLEKEAQEAKRLTAVIDQDLLAERRLTARERWLMERVAKAVLPRHLTREQYALLLPKLRGLGTINLAILDQREPRDFGMELAHLFREAGVLGQIIMLPSNSDQWGATVYSPGVKDSKIADVLWREGGIGGAILGIRTADLTDIPENELCLIIGKNDIAFHPMNGQPGEGLDENNRPVPAPR